MPKNKDKASGYKRIVSVGMEVEQPGFGMGSTKPHWLHKVNADVNSWHLDTSGPYEFSFKPAMKNLSEIFVVFAEGVPDHKKWKWVNQYAGTNSYANSSQSIGCGSHIHLGLLQSEINDRRSESLVQATILWNSAVTLLPFAGKWLSWDNDDKFRHKAFSSYAYASLKNKCKRYTPSTMSRYMKSHTGRTHYEFMTLNRNGKEKITYEIRSNEAMPQWSLPFIDMFLLISYKHIEVGESPKLKRHREVMNWLDTQYTSFGKIRDLSHVIEFEEGKELYAPVPHIIGEKFPRVMTIEVFLHLIDRIAYWIFSYSSRKYYTKQMRFKALGGHPSKLPVNMMWEPWKFTVKEMLEATGESDLFMTARAVKANKFPKLDNTTHSPFAHVRLGAARTPNGEESVHNETSDVEERASDILENILGPTVQEVPEPNHIDDMIHDSSHATIVTEGTNIIPNIYTTIRLEHHEFGECDECDTIHRELMDADVYGSTGLPIICEGCIETNECTHGLNLITGDNCVSCMGSGPGCDNHPISEPRCIQCMQRAYRSYNRWKDRARIAIQRIRLQSAHYGDTDTLYRDRSEQFNREFQLQPVAFTIQEDEE